MTTTIGGYPMGSAKDLRYENTKVLVIGPPKTGKTSSVARAYATYDEQKRVSGYRIFFIVISDHTALLPLLVQPNGTEVHAVGHSVEIPYVSLDPRNLLKEHDYRISKAFWAVANDLTRFFAVTPRDKRPFDAVAIDGLNFLGAALDDEFEKHGPKGWAKWDAHDAFFNTDLIAWATNLGKQQRHALDIYFIGHSADATFKEDGKVKSRGGAALPTRRLAEQFPGKCDMVLWADTIPQPGSHAKRTLFTAPDPERVAGDRFHICAPQEPMDMTAIVKRMHAVLGR